MTTPDGGDEAEPIVVSYQHWELGTNLADLGRSAQAWREFGDAAQQRADDLVAGFAGLFASDWSGVARGYYEERHQRLVGALDEVKTEAYAAAHEVDGIADLVRVHQESLSTSRSTLQAAVSSTLDPSEPGGAIVFFPRAGGDVDAIQAATEEADQIRAEFDRALAAYMFRFGTGDWEALESMWQQPQAMGPFITTMPNDPSVTSQLWIDGRVVLNTGRAWDRVTVTVDPRTGEIRIDVNGTEYTYPPGTPITIRTGTGNDVVEVDGAVTVDLVLLGGTGNNWLQGGGGDDLILAGANMDDLLGGGGNDYLSGGPGTTTWTVRTATTGCPEGSGTTRSTGSQARTTWPAVRATTISKAGRALTPSTVAPVATSSPAGGETTRCAAAPAGMCSTPATDRTRWTVGADGTPDTGRTGTAPPTWPPTSGSRSPTTPGSSRSRGRQTSSSGSRRTWTCCGPRRPASRCWPSWRSCATRTAGPASAT